MIGQMASAISFSRRRDCFRPLTVRISPLFSFRAILLFMVLFSSVVNLVSSAVLPQACNSAHLYSGRVVSRLNNANILILCIATTPWPFRRTLILAPSMIPSPMVVWTLRLGWMEGLVVTR